MKKILVLAGIVITRRSESTDNRIEVFVNDKSVWVEPGEYIYKISYFYICFPS